MRNAKWKWILVVSLMVASVFARRAEAQGEFLADAAVQYGPSVVKFLAEYGLGKILDGIYDSVTGQPDVNLLQQRLEALEKNTALKSELQEAIHSFRLELNTRVSREEMEQKLGHLYNKLAGIHTRLENLEVDRELHEARISDLENKTSLASDPLYFVRQGRRHFEAGDSVRALANYAAALRVDQRCAEAYLARAFLYLKSNAVEVAEIDYSNGESIDPDSTEGRIGRATACYILQRWDDVVAETTQALKRDPKLFDAYFLRGSARRSKGELEGSGDDLLSAIGIKPNSSLAWNSLGVTRKLSKDHEAAESAFDRAIAIDPLPMFYLNRGDLYRDQGDFEKALKDIDKSLEYVVLKPAADVSSELGPIAANYYVRVRKHVGSVSDTSYPHEIRGLTLSAMGRGSDAVPELTKAIAMGTQNGWVHAIRGKERIVAKEYRDGLSDTDEGLRLGISRELEYFVFHNRAIANYYLGNFASAASDTKRSLEAPYSGSDNLWKGDAHYLSFLANERINQGTAAYQSLMDAIRIKPNLTERFDSGFIQVVNKTNREIDFCPDYWIAYDGSKVDVNNNWAFRGSELFWRFKPGEEAFLAVDGQHFRASKISAWMENAGSSKYGGTWTWNCVPGKAITLIEIKDEMLP